MKFGGCVYRHAGCDIGNGGKQPVGSGAAHAASACCGADRQPPQQPRAQRTQTSPSTMVPAGYPAKPGSAGCVGKTSGSMSLPQASQVPYTVVSAANFKVFIFVSPWLFACSMN
jgi:hypothetical protein